MFPTFKNINDYFKAKPPMVVFFICLVILMVATFYFAIYVKRTDKIVNTDVKQSWESLAKHLNNLNLCENFSVPNHPQFVEATSFSVSINVNLTRYQFDRNVTQIRVYYDLTDWHPHCSENTTKYENSQYLSVTVDIPQNSSGNDKTCALIEGPKQYLSNYHAYSCDLSQTNRVRRSESSFVLFSCSSSANLTSSKILFDENENFEIYLTDNDKNLIYLHLMWCGYVLSFCILIVLISAMFYSGDYVNIKK